MKYTITEALISLKPEAEWAVRGGNYSDIVWLDETQTMPTEDEINAKIAELEQKNQRDKFVKLEIDYLPSLTGHKAVMLYF
ncbi:MAG: hypothetical protein CM15mV9_2550 [uncultured marine virus]|nr:MAG: hypothetical protein CM15mV9_2550 [uncultured marine virus]